MALPWTIGADPHALARSWALALDDVLEPGYDDPDGASIIDPGRVGPAIRSLRVLEPKIGKNRFHLDLRPAGEPPWDPAVREQPVRERGDLRATRAREEHDDDGSSHVVMWDPEGDEFCVA